MGPVGDQLERVDCGLAGGVVERLDDGGWRRRDANCGAGCEMEDEGDQGGDAHGDVERGRARGGDPEGKQEREDAVLEEEEQFVEHAAMHSGWKCVDGLTRCGVYLGRVKVVDGWFAGLLVVW